MKDDKKVIVKRNDLYQKAWSKPMTKLAAEGGNARGMNSLGVMYQKGYAIFQVTQKVEPKESLEIFKKGKDKVRSIMYTQKLIKRLNNHTVELAQKYNLQINEAALREITVSQISTMVYRKLGFGGNINAVPYLSLKLSRNALK